MVKAAVAQEAATEMVSPTMIFSIFLAMREIIMPSSLKSRNSMKKIMSNDPQPQDLY